VIDVNIQIENFHVIVGPLTVFEFIQMPVDQPANPRIRTKVNCMDHQIDDEFYQLTERLRTGEIDVDAYQAETLAFLQDKGLKKSFADDIAFARSSDDQHWLLRRHTEHCRYTILFFSVKEHEVHPPHQHHNLISTQVVIEGKIHLREYQRVRTNEDDRLEMKLVRDDVLGPGEVFQASEWHNNVHWFCGIEGPALVFQINARGYEKETFDTEDNGPFGRRYIDPTHFDDDGLITCDQFDEAEAERRFQGKPLSNFPAPVSVASNADFKTISL
jgi:hypothetical protein